MRKCVLVAATLAACSPASVLAQTPNQTQTKRPAAAQAAYPAPAKWFVNFHGGAQVGSQDLSRSADFTLYEEPATFQTEQTANGGGLIDIGGAMRLYENYGAGVSYAFFESSGDSNFSGSLPHPLLFDRPRNFNGSAPVDHKERAVHIQAVWFIPFTDKIDFTVGAGPSFFTVEQGFARGIQFSEIPPNFDSVTVDSVDVATIKESGVGFNLGANMTYAITRRIGASVMLRYARGSLTFGVAEGQTVDVTAGGFQFGAGVAVRFAGGWPPWK